MKDLKKAVDAIIKNDFKIAFRILSPIAEDEMLEVGMDPHIVNVLREL